MINLPRMKNAMHFNFHTEMLAIIKADETLSGKVSGQLQAYEHAFNAEQIAYSLSKKNFLTDEIAQGDKERDALYRMLQNGVKYSSKLEDAARRRACKVLAQAMKDYNIDVKAHLDEETGALTNLINDLRSKYLAEVTLLSLTDTVNLLYEANEKVRMAMRSRTGENGVKPVSAMGNARADTDKAYRALVKYLNACVTVEATSVYDEKINNMNAIIDHYNKVLKLKANLNPNEEDGTEEIPDPIAPGKPSESEGNTPGDGDESDGKTDGKAGESSGGNSGEEELPDPLA